jgi:acyl-CoA synthetase (AMP-forming)/AMP-acid ligase II
MPVTPTIWRGGSLPDHTADSLVAFASAAALRAPGEPALIDAPTGTTVLYGELTERMLRVASSLAAMGLNRGEVVATLTPNSTHWAIFALGTMAAGGVVTGVNPGLRPNEIARQLMASGATVIAVASGVVPMVEAAGLGRLVKAVVVLDEDAAGPYRTLADLVRDGRAAPRSPEPDDLALLPFSSGTSGLPKGVAVTGRSLALAGVAAGGALGLTDADRWLAVAPYFHIVAISTLAAALARGTPIVIASAPDAGSLLEAIERYRITMTVITPPALHALAGHPHVARRDLSSLRAIGCTAAPLSAERQTEAARCLGTTVFQAYGMTESVGAITLGPLSDPRPGSCGKPAPGTEIRVVEPETGAELSCGQCGEVLFRAPFSMHGYRNDAKATQQAMTADGWVRTGDVGYFDEDENLFIVDRLKELIKVDAASVSPAELEALLTAYPGVDDAAVVGRPSPVTGESPVGYVVANEPIEAASLLRWVAERVAPFKRLQAIEFVDAIPRQPNGKIMRRLLGERDGAD